MESFWATFLSDSSRNLQFKPRAWRYSDKVKAALSMAASRLRNHESRKRL